MMSKTAMAFPKVPVPFPPGSTEIAGMATSARADEACSLDLWRLEEAATGTTLAFGFLTSPQSRPIILHSQIVFHYLEHTRLAGFGRSLSELLCAGAFSSMFGLLIHTRLLSGRIYNRNVRQLCRETTNSSFHQSGGNLTCINRSSERLPRLAPPP